MGLSDIFIRVLCIGSVLLYAATASLVTAPQVKISPVVSNISQIENGQTSTFSLATVQKKFLFDSLVARVNSLEPLFRIIGKHQQPVAIVVDSDHPARISIGSTDIIIGNKAASSIGQLERALIKTWIRQNASSEVLANPLRVEVYSDLLLATFTGKLDLHDPENLQVANFTTVDNWVNDLHGTAELCESGWRPVELIQYCSGLKGSAVEAQSSYSLRKVIGNLIWSEIGRSQLLSRKTILESLSQNVRTPKMMVATLKQLEVGSLDSTNLDRLRTSIEAEAQEIYPQLAQVLPKVEPSIGMLKSGRVSYLGGFSIESDQHQFKRLIIEACETPKLEELLAQSSETTEHILFVQNCENKRITYDGFAESGIAKFAQQNRSIKFAYLHRESLKLANKMINNFDIQAALSFNPASKNAKFLGLDQKIFREDLGAYKVNGPIGAIEWFRSGKS